MSPVSSGAPVPALMRFSHTSATVTRIVFLTGPVPVTVDPRKEHDDDDDADAKGPRGSQTREPHHATGHRPKLRSTDVVDDDHDDYDGGDAKRPKRTQD